MNRKKVFISYSHNDEVWRRGIVTQLRVLERQDLLQLWDDTQIGAGQNWLDRIHAALCDARVAILLISADYLISNFVAEEEVPTLLQRHVEDGMVIVPVLLRPCPWQEVGWLAKMQIRPKGGRAISSGNQNQIDQDFSEVAREVIGILRKSVPDASIDRAGSLSPRKSKATFFGVGIWIVLLSIAAAATALWLRPFGF